ncbi:hypothetical protein GBAR_LOCUS15270 [Geodia barretti]|uniref:Uncharacterized protein n=1 Tax=Geodia barretti TaxID=519541 RepID=A0AA35SAQ5_GEOBA|nr:hypothetical protein GBAR_LOCUS15270 [Geodia barretti]CAI8026600.1 hypothetical protein GBAR_LOCUS15270 [Geodia barretti]
MSITSRFLVFFFGLTYSSATLTVEVDLISYSNPTSEDCNGGNCEGVYYGTCDNVFLFCLRVVGSEFCLASLGTNYVQDDSMTFSSYDLSRLGISNPLVFSSISTSSLLELYVNITDYDSIGDNDTVDDITIPLSGRLEADSQFSLSKTYSGSCGRASLAVKFRLTSQCPTNQYGPQCDKECIEEPQQTLCNYLGESVDLAPMDLMEILPSAGVKDIFWNPAAFSAMMITTRQANVTFSAVQEIATSGATTGAILRPVKKFVLKATKIHRLYVWTKTKIMMEGQVPLQVQHLGL